MIRLKLPCYFTIGKRKKKTSLISVNWFSSLNPYVQREFKRSYKDIIARKLQESHTEQINGRYRVTYTYNYKNAKSDITNVCSVISKELNDVLQELDIVVDDNVKFLIEEKFIVGSKDNDGYVDITIEPLEDK